MASNPHSQRGVSLIEVACVLLLSGVVAGAYIKFTTVNDMASCYATTKTQLNIVKEAIDRYATKNRRYPMPARRNVGVESSFYGREAALSDLDKITNANGTTAVYGALPFQAIGVPVENASDCWGNKLTYVVTKDLTVSAKYLDPSVNGAIDIKTDNTNTVYLPGASYAVISHGQDGLGAVKSNYDSGVSNNPETRKWCKSSAVISSQNCDVTNNELVDTAYNDGKDAGNNYFDDVLIYRGLRSINGQCSTNPNNCLAGTAKSYTDSGCDGSKDWTCAGSGGGTDATCSVANPACPPPPPPPPPPPVVPPVAPPPTAGAQCGASAGTCDVGSPSGTFSNCNVSAMISWTCSTGSGMPAGCSVPNTSCGNPLPSSPVNCGWTDWSACDKPCDGGTQWRAPNNPPASNGGAPCTGNATQQCNMFACPNNPTGTWTPVVGACSKPCGGGTQSVTYTCSGGNGKCDASSRPADGSQSCNTQFCADPPPACGAAPGTCDVGSPGGYMENACGGARWGCYSSTYFPAKCHYNWGQCP